MKIGRIHLAILVVNGKDSSYKNIPWLKLCLDNIVKHTTKRVYRVFVWNHDYENKQVLRLFNKYREIVIPLDSRVTSLSTYQSPRMKGRGPLSWRGFHIHRTPLQVISEIARALYDIDCFVTMDSDSWPILDGWDNLFFTYLKTYKLVGVWRDELKEAIKPYVHPSGLGIRRSLLKKEKLRFDKKPFGQGEDTLSHFSRLIYRKYGTRSIRKLKRSNKVNLHPVAGGIYGDMIYHHHLGNRFTKGMEPLFKGSMKRGETIESNMQIIGEMTSRVFLDYNDYIAELKGGYDENCLCNSSAWKG